MVHVIHWIKKMSADDEGYDLPGGGRKLSRDEFEKRQKAKRLEILKRKAAQEAARRKANVRFEGTAEGKYATRKAAVVRRHVGKAGGPLVAAAKKVIANMKNPKARAAK